MIKPVVQLEATGCGIASVAASAVLDPKKTLRRHARTDFGRMQPKWSIRLTRP
jgi:hypothetical protein